jgi:hypothetical protein
MVLGVVRTDAMVEASIRNCNDHLDPNTDQRVKSSPVDILLITFVFMTLQNSPSYPCLHVPVYDNAINRCLDNY